jgi:hypothetical protein
MPVDFETEITYLSNLPSFGRYLATALRGIQNGVNNLGKNLAADPVTTLPPPSPVQLTVKSNGSGLVHAVISDNSAISKHINYFIEYSTNASFQGAHVRQLGASRSMDPLTLPGNNDNGQPQSFYFRAYSSYPGGNPGKPVNFGGSTPTAVSPGGSQNMTLLSSTGSGTANSNGQQPGSGFGVVLNRPATVNSKATT